ncbi:hypothetical protein Ahy_B09g099277 [Arachis hypogaea]|uniref:Uncharacterized protein n=2 Tax=Arachis hypogaea TaxID=3818 RepID=A0A444XTC6_ARAHY|nr:hypothetical protein Ahy_B09g099277 [Arachis hypogaea]
MNQRRATISLFNSFLRIRYPLRPSTTTLTSPLPFFVTNSTSKPQSIRTIAPMVWQNPRSYSSGSCNDLDHNKEVDAINLKFAEAREVLVLQVLSWMWCHLILCFLTRFLPEFSPVVESSPRLAQQEEIETALESKETVYFDEEAECARAAVKEVLGMFDGLLARLSEKEKGALQRSMGLKIEQLKAELKQLDE